MESVGAIPVPFAFEQDVMIDTAIRSDIGASSSSLDISI